MGLMRQGKGEKGREGKGREERSERGRRKVLINGVLWRKGRTRGLTRACR